MKPLVAADQVKTRIDRINMINKIQPDPYRSRCSSVLFFDLIL